MKSLEDCGKKIEELRLLNLWDGFRKDWEKVYEWLDERIYDGSGFCDAYRLAAADIRAVETKYLPADSLHSLHREIVQHELALRLHCPFSL